MENCPCHLSALPFSYILSRSKFHYVSWQNKNWPFKKNLCVCTYMCRPVCTSVEVRGQQWMSPFSSLIFWDKNSHWNWSSASVTPGAAQHCPEHNSPVLTRKAGTTCRIPWGKSCSLKEQVRRVSGHLLTWSFSCYLLYTSHPLQESCSNYTGPQGLRGSGAED